MEWHQQYGRFCKDCEYWEGLSYPNRKNFRGIQGTCHRFPPCRFCSETSQWTKPVTMDSDGCGEFKLIARLQKDIPLQLTEQLPPVHSASKITNLAPDIDGLINVKQLSVILNVSSRRIWSMRSGGQIPLPVKIGGSVRWKTREMLDWIEQGCPPLRKWEVLKKNKKY